MLQLYRLLHRNYIMGCKVGLLCYGILLLNTEVAMEANITGHYEWSAVTEEGDSYRPAVTSESGGSLPAVPTEYELGSQPAAAARRTSSLSSTTRHQVNSIPVEILDSGIENVEQYDTVIFFYIQVESLDSYAINISVSADVCCVFVDERDTICGQLMVLAPPVILQLDEYTPAQEARFMFRNLYATHRHGNCTFDISPLSNGTQKWKNIKHAIMFDTYPTDYDSTNPTCNGIDLDPDRSCTPVDCVIKYEGLRNFFRNSTKKCEEVVDCDTRGKDGVSIVAYFDWEDNTCVPLLDEEPTTYVEDIPETEIPIEFDPERNKIIPEFEYSRRLQLVKSGEYKLKCNHGRQEEGTCVCNDGWRSSGIHATNLLEFNYCDQEDDDGLMGDSYGPRRFPRAIEIVIICVMGIAIVLLTLLWFILAYKFTKAVMAKRSRTATYGLLEEVVPHSLK